MCRSPEKPSVPEAVGERPAASNCSGDAETRTDGENKDVCIGAETHANDREGQMDMGAILGNGKYLLYAG